MGRHRRDADGWPIGRPKPSPTHPMPPAPSEAALERTEEVRAAIPEPPKPEDLPIEQRLLQVEAWLASGYRHRQTVEMIRDKFKVSSTIALKYIRRVEEQWAEEGAREAPHRRDKLRAAMWDFYLKAMTDGAWTAAGQMLDRLARLDGCYQPEQVEVAHSAAIAAAEPDRIRERIKQLLPLVKLPS